MSSVFIRWQEMSEQDCWSVLYQTGGALRRMGEYALAKRVEKVADKLYPGEIKPAPIVPRTIT